MQHLLPKSACASVTNLKLHRYDYVYVEAQVPINQLPREPLLIVYQNRTYKIKLTPQMVPGSKVITKIYHVPLSEEDAAAAKQQQQQQQSGTENVTNNTNENSIPSYRNLGVRRKKPHWHTIEPKVWSGDNRTCEAHMCIAKELIWIERNLKHILEDGYADEDQIWNGQLWRDRVRICRHFENVGAESEILT